MINDYFTLLASLEYNMQEIQKVQKLMNDLVDITVTVILRDFKEARNSFFGLGVYVLKSKFRIEDKLRFP